MKTVILIALVIFGIAGGIWAVLIGPLRDPKAALDDFLEGRGRAEGQLTDPLVLAGPRVRPALLAAVASRGCPVGATRWRILDASSTLLREKPCAASFLTTLNSTISVLMPSRHCGGLLHKKRPIWRASF